MKTRLLSKVLTLVVLSLSLICSTALADINFTSSGNNLRTIPDASFSSNSGAGITDTVSITQNEIITDAKFRIEGVNHTWIGDLIVTVTHDGQTATLIERAGRPAGGPGLGFDTNLNGDYVFVCLLYTSPSPRDATLSRMPSSA